MKFRMCAFVSIVLALQAPAALAQWYSIDLPGMEFDGSAFQFEEVAEDIYQAQGTGNLLVGSNAAIIVNENDVIVIDSHISPAAAVALARQLPSITTKPIRYVINTHFHFDHAHGNQVYPPEVQIIGHEFTYEMLATGESIGRTYEHFKDWISSQPGGAQGQQGLIPTPPNMTMADRMTLFRDGREIQLLFFGRGHTGGDIVVYLPQEKILFTGDLLLESIPFMGDAYPSDWIETLEGLSQLDFNVVVPGHGRPFADRARIGHLQSLLTDLWQRAKQSCDQGMSAELAAEKIDISNHSEAYSTLTGPGVPIEAVERVYELTGCGR
jgi:cyclase